MIQFICDRCKKPIPDDAAKFGASSYEIRKRIKGGKDKGLEKPLDLCPECDASFLKWLASKK